jgi:uncharacterized protein YegP (UPF0339 family)
MWKVQTIDETQVAYSETYAQRQGAISAVSAVKAGQCTYEIFNGSDGHWYFHIKVLNHLILARSSRRYIAQTDAAAAAAMMRDNAAAPAFYDYARAA